MDDTSWPYRSRKPLSIQNYIISYLDGQLLVGLVLAVAEEDLVKGTMTDGMKSLIFFIKRVYTKID